MMAIKQTIVTATFTVFTLACSVFMYLPMHVLNQNKNYNEYIKTHPYEVPLEITLYCSNLYFTYALCGLSLLFLVIKSFYGYRLKNTHGNLKSLGGKFYTYEIFRNLFVIFSHVLFAFNFLFTTIYWICYFTNQNMMNPEKSLEEDYGIPMAYKLGAYLAPFIFSIDNMIYLAFIKNTVYKINTHFKHYLVMFYTVGLIIGFLSMHYIKHTYPFPMFNNMAEYLVYLVLIGYGLAAEVVVYVMPKIIRKDSDEMDKIFEKQKEKIRS